MSQLELERRVHDGRVDRGRVAEVLETARTELEAEAARRAPAEVVGDEAAPEPPRVLALPPAVGGIDW